MSIRFRIDSVQLGTSGGPVRYEFKGPLTVLSGPVGTGKSSLFELIKHAVGGQALFSPVVTEHVSNVQVELSVGQERLRLSRSIKDDAGRVSVTDLITRESRGEFTVQPSASDAAESLSDLLLSALGIPADLRAVAASRKSTRVPPRITFNDIWSYLYVDQPEIDRSIVSHTESYREPKRKTVFELLFGLSDPELLRMKASLQEVDVKLAATTANEAVVLNFLREVGTEDRLAALAEQEELLRELGRNKAALERLRQESDPADARTDVLRDLLVGTQERADKSRHMLLELEQSQEDRRNLAAGVRQEIARLNRTRDAVGRLAPIEFTTCPRCTQTVKARSVPPGTCRLCLQSEIDTSADSRLDSYELTQLQAQLDEIEELLDAGYRQLAISRQQLAEMDRHADDLAREVNERTYELVSPRLQAFADVSGAIGKAEERLKSLEDALRLWDRVEDIAAEAIRLRQEQLRLEREIREREADLRERREILQTMSADYQDVVERLGVPGVRSAVIDEKSYLPFGDGRRFDKISTGGIRTALVVAYWTTLLATALRNGQTLMPAMLILDSPRKSIGAGEALAANLYKQLDILAENYRNAAQIIVADNSLPREYSRRWQEIYFDYDQPVISTVPHPGPAGIVTIDQMARRGKAEDAE